MRDEAICLQCGMHHAGWQPCAPRERPHTPRVTQEELRALARRSERLRIEAEAVLERQAAEAEDRRRAMTEAVWREEMARIRAHSNARSAEELAAARRQVVVDQEEARRQRRAQGMARRLGLRQDSEEEARHG